jgi:hypothetical protein
VATSCEAVNPHAALIPDDLLEIRKSFGLVRSDISTLAVPGRHVLINPVVVADQFGESFVPKFRVPLGSAHIEARQDFPNRGMAIGTVLQLLVSHGLFDLKDLAEGTGLPDMFVFIDRHKETFTPYELGIKPPSMEKERLDFVCHSVILKKRSAAVKGKDTG